MDIDHAFCPLPWIHTSTDSIGNMRMCCMANVPQQSYLRRPDRTRFNAEVDKIPRNDKLLCGVRAEMVKGIRPRICQQCWSIENAGFRSNRLVAKDLLYPEVMQQAKDLTNDDGTIEPKDFPIKYYDLRLGNRCNCKCMICNEVNSSMWMGRVCDWSNGELETPYLKDMLQNIESVDRFYLTGGEPTINKAHWKLIDLLINEGHAKNVHLDYNSNCVYLTKDMLDKWSNFKFVHLGFSIDGIGEVHEMIRYPSKWATIEKNLNLFEEYSHPNTYAAISLTIQKFNILNAIDFFKWNIKNNFKKIRTVPHFNILLRPFELSIRRLDSEQKNNIKQEYETFYLWLKDNCPEEIYDEALTNFKGVINSMYCEDSLG